MIPGHRGHNYGREDALEFLDSRPAVDMPEWGEDEVRPQVSMGDNIGLVDTKKDVVLEDIYGRAGASDCILKFESRIK
jgi:hypothetical protein